MDILRVLLEISIYSAILFGAIVLFKKVLGKRMSPSLHVLLWFILIARLLMPVTLDSGLRLIRLPAHNAAQTQQSAADVPGQEMDASAAATAPAGTAGPGAAQQSAEPAAYQQPTAGGMAQSQTAEYRTIAWDPQKILVAVWLLGIAVCLAHLFISYLHWARKIRQNAFEPTARLAALFEECKRSLGVRGKVELLGVGSLATPALFAPHIILMPMQLIVSGDDEQILFALRHELTHYKRGDHALSVLLSFLQAVYWFNPVVRLAARQMRADMEVACDNAVAQNWAQAKKSVTRS